MDRQSFTDLIQTKFKMVRIEAGYTQDTMAQTIGLSKKTLVQIEKERVLPNWTTCVSIMKNSQSLVLQKWGKLKLTSIEMLKKN